MMIFSSMVFAEDLNRLYVESGSASSFLQSNWNKYQENYHPNYAFDDNPATAWVEGVDGNGENEFLEWEVSQLDKADELKVEIFNGYQKSKSLLAANGAAKDIELTVFGLKPQFQSTIRWSLENKMGPQSVTFNFPENHGLTKFRLTILSTHPGKTYKDTCISDIRVLVKSKVPYNPGRENEKSLKLKAWIKERLDVAKFFANQPVSYPFASANFQRDDIRNYYKAEIQGSAIPGKDTFYVKDFKTAYRYDFLKQGLTLLRYGADLKSKGLWSKIAQKNPSLQFIPDGLDSDMLETSFMKFFGPGDLTFFEVSSPISQVNSQKQTDEYSLKEEKISQFKVTKENNKIAAISWVTHVKGMERGPYEYVGTHVLVYENDKLLWYVRSTKGDGLYHDVIRFGYDRANKINEVTRVRYTPESEYELSYTYEHYIPKKITVGKK